MLFTFLTNNYEVFIRYIMYFMELPKEINWIVVVQTVFHTWFFKLKMVAFGNYVHEGNICSFNFFFMNISLNQC